MNRSRWGERFLRFTMLSGTVDGKERSHSGEFVASFVIPECRDTRTSRTWTLKYRGPVILKQVRRLPKVDLNIW